MDDASIRLALRRRRFFRIGLVVAPLMFIAVGAFVFFAGNAFGWDPAPGPVSAIMFLLFFFAVVANFYLVGAPCPRCGKKFWYDETSTYRNQLTPQCLNCGLSIHWRQSDEAV
jgi:endogenous inhibitor of DNA gyrase (YacG/DUF329 family)